MAATEDDFDLRQHTSTEFDQFVDIGDRGGKTRYADDGKSVLLQVSLEILQALFEKLRITDTDLETVMPQHAGNIGHAKVEVVVTGPSLPLSPLLVRIPEGEDQTDLEFFCVLVGCRHRCQ